MSHDAGKVTSEERINPATDTGLEPLTLSLLGRFFGVPLLIIGVIVGGAVCVVLLFGGPVSAPRTSLDELLQGLEASTGERSLGLLLPAEKALWQQALELTQRLDKRELSDEELIAAGDRLCAMVRSELDTLDKLPTVGAERERQRELRAGRFVFLIRALGKVPRAESVGALVDVLRRKQEPFVAAAAEALGNLREMPSARAAAGDLVGVLGGTFSDETLIVSSTALSVLASPGDATAIEALGRLVVSHEGDVAWSSALALARLGSDKGKSTLLDMLDRSFWEAPDRYQSVDRSGATRRYAMPPKRIEQFLIAAMDASSNLDDAALWESIRKLESDPSLAVRGRAKELQAARAGGRP